MSVGDLALLSDCRTAALVTLGGDVEVSLELVPRPEYGLTVALPRGPDPAARCLAETAA